MITVYGIETLSVHPAVSARVGWNDMITVYGIETEIFPALRVSVLQLERYDYRLRY